MSSTNFAEWRDHDLRIIYFDFTQRGLGERTLVTEALMEWHRRGTLAAEQLNYWLDALDWRDAGRTLPGWPCQPVERPLEVEPEREEREFERWRLSGKAAA